MTIDIAYFENALHTNAGTEVFEPRDLQVFTDEAGKPIKKGKEAIIQVEAVPDQEIHEHANGDIGVLVREPAGHPLLKERTGFLNIFHTTPSHIRVDILKALAEGKEVPVIVYKEGKDRLPEAKDFKVKADK